MNIDEFLISMKINKINEILENNKNSIIEILNIPTFYSINKNILKNKSNSLTLNYVHDINEYNNFKSNHHKLCDDLYIYTLLKIDNKTIEIIKKDDDKNFKYTKTEDDNIIIKILFYKQNNYSNGNLIDKSAKNILYSQLDVCDILQTFYDKNKLYNINTENIIYIIDNNNFFKIKSNLLNLNFSDKKNYSNKYINDNITLLQENDQIKKLFDKIKIEKLSVQQMNIYLYGHFFIQLYLLNNNIIFIELGLLILNLLNLLNINNKYNFNDIKVIINLLLYKNDKKYITKINNIDNINVFYKYIINNNENIESLIDNLYKNDIPDFIIKKKVNYGDYKNNNNILTKNEDIQKKLLENENNIKKIKDLLNSNKLIENLTKLNDIKKSF